MKKLLAVLGLSLTLVSAEATNVRTNLSFINPYVVSIALSNVAGLGVTNLLVGAQLGGYWTNVPGSSQAVGTGLTNWAGAGLFTMYTQAITPLIVSGTNLPGVLVIDVITNTANTPGVFGYPPFNGTNLTWAKTNDALNLFQDVVFPSDWSPGIGGVASGSVVGGVITNNNPGVSYNAALEIQLLGTQLTGTANGSNYVTFVFAPLLSDGTQIINTQVPAVSGNYPSLAPFTLLVTNSASATALCSSIIPIPSSVLIGASGLRLVSATPGSAWTTGGELWLTRCRLILISNSQ